LGCATVPANLSIDAAAWREDLEFVKHELPKRHLNAFHAVSRERFEAALDDLEAQAAEQNPDARYVGLMAAINLIGDGHTAVRGVPDRGVFPIEIRAFDGEHRISRAGSGFERALGARVLAIGETPIQDVVARTLALTPADENPPLRDSLSLHLARMGLILHGLGIIPERSHAAFRLQADGGEAFTLDLPGSPALNDAGWLRPYREPPLCDQHPGDPFWCTAIPSAKAVYCDFRGYDGLGSRSREMIDLVERTAAERLIVDLRDNGGGDNTVGLAKVIEPVQRMARINRKGHLFVLIGPETFSAAMNNAAQFRTMTAATLVGESIGEKPNSYQEPKEMTLPNSHLIVRYSTEWYAFVKDGPNSVDPDVRVVPTWTQYAGGQDPVLDYALSSDPGAHSPAPPPGGRPRF
jgi:hypothetical protein